MLILAVTIHNIPEGMAVGVALAGAMANNSSISIAEALALAFGIGIQNFPEGAIISMPIGVEKSKNRAFIIGTLSGIVEPIFAVATLLCARLVVPALPYLLSFAAGAMLYVACVELIPEMQENKKSNLGIIMLTVGFCIMMILDVSL